MGYHVKMMPAAARDLRALPSAILPRVDARIRALAENPVGARKTHDQRQYHRKEETDAKHPWVDAPG